MITLQIGLATEGDASAKFHGLGDLALFEGPVGARRKEMARIRGKNAELKVSINMAISLDGKIATKSRGPMKLGTKLDTQRMAEIRADHDAVINGAGTFRAYPFPLLVKNAKLVRKREKKGLTPHPISAIVSSRLNIPRGTPWEKSRLTERWVFCGAKAPAKTISSLEKNGIKVIRSRNESPKPEEILRAFRAAGVKRLLVEGGGELNASFLEKSLVHNIHLTLTPLVIGGRESPSWVEGKGFSLGEFPRFRLKQAQVRGQEIYLTYARA